MTDTMPDKSLDRSLISLLDEALASIMQDLQPEQRSRLRAKVAEMGLAQHIKQQCSPDIQILLLDERPQANPDGGLIGEAAVEPAASTDETPVEEGSAKTSSIPTS
ncbi:MAG: hypothetical protein AAGC69_01000 [Paracraurococcus sp.]